MSEELLIAFEKLNYKDPAVKILKAADVFGCFKDVFDFIRKHRIAEELDPVLMEMATTTCLNLLMELSEEKFGQFPTGFIMPSGQFSFMGRTDSFMLDVMRGRGLKLYHNLTVEGVYYGYHERFDDKKMAEYIQFLLDWGRAIANNFDHTPTVLLTSTGLTLASNHLQFTHLTPENDKNYLRHMQPLLNRAKESDVLDCASYVMDFETGQFTVEFVDSANGFLNGWRAGQWMAFLKDYQPQLCENLRPGRASKTSVVGYLKGRPK